MFLVLTWTLSEQFRISVTNPEHEKFPSGNFGAFCLSPATKNVGPFPAEFCLALTKEGVIVSPRVCLGLSKNNEVFQGWIFITMFVLLRLVRSQCWNYAEFPINLLTGCSFLFLALFHPIQDGLLLFPSHIWLVCSKSCRFIWHILVKLCMTDCSANLIQLRKSLIRLGLFTTVHTDFFLSQIYDLNTNYFYAKFGRFLFYFFKLECFTTDW